jgi:hypothetical protein
VHKKESLRCLQVFARCAISEVISGPSSEIFFVWEEISMFAPTDCLRNQECNKKERYRLAFA